MLRLADAQGDAFMIRLRVFCGAIVCRLLVSVHQNRSFLRGYRLLESVVTLVRLVFPCFPLLSIFFLSFRVPLDRTDLV